jgi:hypothetical protein
VVLREGKVIMNSPDDGREPPKAQAADHMGAAENWLAIAEEAATARTELHAERDAFHTHPEPGDDVEALEEKFWRLTSQADALLEQGVALAREHREMAQAYWSAPRTVTQSAQMSAGPDWVLSKLQVDNPFPAAYGQEESSRSYAEQRRLEDARLQDTAARSRPGCECCNSGLPYDPEVDPYETMCASCGHVVARHNVMVPANRRARGRT